MKAVIIGNSAAGLNALESFRKYDSESRVTIISREPGPAYSRVLLPYYLRKKIPYENLFLNNFDYYKELKAETIFEKTVIGLKNKHKVLELSDGQNIEFDRLLIATGGVPVKPLVKNLEGPGIYHMWTLDDAQRIESYFQPGKRLLVLGSGFVSLQAAWSAVQQGLSVTVFELMSRIMPQVLDEKCAGILHKRILEYGVNLKVDTLTEKVERKQNGSITVYARNEKPFDVDLIIVGTGVRPNMVFLQNSSIMVDRGILVNEKMETNVPGIYAAGDAAQGPTVFGNLHVVHALWPTAVEQGKVAGANMAGRNVSYQGSLNMNVTQMFGITIASMGQFEGGAHCEVRECFEVKEGKYCKIVFSQGIPVGGIVAGDFEQVALLGLLRPLIREKKKFTGGLDSIAKNLHLKLGFQKEICYIR